MTMLPKALIFLFWLVPLTLADGVCDFDTVGAIGFVTCKSLNQADDYLYQMYKIKPEFDKASLTDIYIFISNSNFQEVNEWFVEPFLDISTKISSLSLYNCFVQRISSDAWSVLSDLTFLSLSKNSIKAYPFLQNLKKLRNLDFSENGLGDLDVANLFSNITSSTMTNVDLSFNAIKNLDFSWSRFANLELDLTYNSIERFDYSNVGVKKAKLSFNPINEILFPPGDLLDYLELAETRVKSIRSTNDAATGTISVNSLYASNLDIDLDLSILSNVTGIQNLILKDNKISSLDSDIILKSLSSGSTLDLSNTSLSSFSNGFFNGTNKLNVLNLTYNSIKQIPANLFNKSQIGTLDLSNSQISQIESEAFSNLVIRTTLNLSGNKLESVENIFGEITIQGTLDLSSNPITKITDTTFQGITGLTELNMINTSISTIYDKSFSSLPTLKSLYITIQGTFNSKGIENHFLKRLGLLYSTITKLEKENFKGLYTLQELFFNNSEIKEVDNSCLDGLFALTDLDAKTLLKYSRTIPIGIFKDLKSLVKLDLSNMTWTTISYEVMKGLIRLEVLDLARNNISEISENSFQDLTSLSILYLSGNQLGSISSQIFQKLWKLEELYIDSNVLTTLPVDLFQNTSLKYLNLSSNLLMSLEPGIFSNLDKLTTLDLSKNRFVTIQSEVFKPLVSLDTLNLENNLLHSLSYFGNVFNYTSLLDTISPRTIQLNGNPWECKSLGFMLNYLGYRNVEFKYPASALYNTDNIVGINCSPEEDMNELTEVLQLNRGDKVLSVEATNKHLVLVSLTLISTNTILFQKYTLRVNISLREKMTKIVYFCGAFVALTLLNPVHGLECFECVAESGQGSPCESKPDNSTRQECAIGLSCLKFIQRIGDQTTIYRRCSPYNFCEVQKSVANGLNEANATSSSSVDQMVIKACEICNSTLCNSVSLPSVNWCYVSIFVTLVHLSGSLIY
ncbi:toll-like receptor 3 [Cylas formicarius]|uniref:toll-like receptor 3 n=1 Tax=Cylas formicarius TaxID=197179 RepID=UPI002958C1F8|nr:toll-like receptor 3 [Cylas formicarius]